MMRTFVNVPELIFKAVMVDDGQVVVTHRPREGGEGREKGRVNDLSLP